VTEPTGGQAVWRGATKRCARCGERKLFRHWVSMVERCPRCGHRFERADGFWLGSIMLNMAFTFGLFLVVFFGGMVVTWPDTPWTLLLILTLLLNSLFPVLFHPFSRTLWVGMEMAARPLEPQEVVDAAAFGTGEWSVAGVESTAHPGS
jgi:uncharacterized protein (DUF983 family)